MNRLPPNIADLLPAEHQVGKTAGGNERRAGHRQGEFLHGGFINRCALELNGNTSRVQYYHFLRLCLHKWHSAKVSVAISVPH